MIRQYYADAVFYPTLWWNMLLGRVLQVRNWWDPIGDDVILGAYPFEIDVPELSRLGVGAVVNTCHEYQGPTNAYEKHGIVQHHIPTTDFTHPSRKDVVSAVDFMDNQIRQGKKVYVHCKAGRARSATIVACWLIRNQQISAVEAQKQMLRSRPHVNKRIAERPVVLEFEKMESKLFTT